jgi:mevalonate kinase
MEDVNAVPTTTTGHAFGKVILLGEHAVVYGVPAIVAGIDRGARARVQALPHGPSSLSVGPVHATRDDRSDLGRAFAAVLDACEIEATVRVDAETELPVAAGLGCSAALGVALVRALDAFRGFGPASPANVASRATHWEKVFHGNPSGIDATAASRGGCFSYRRLDAAASVKDLALHRPLTIAVGHTGIASSTRAMVERVAELRKRTPDLVRRAFESIEAIVRFAETAIDSSDHAALGALMDQNQTILGSLSVSCDQIETMCRSAKENGALGAKLTGAGGGGCVIALAGERPETILEGWEKRGFRAFASTVARTSPPASERTCVP